MKNFFSLSEADILREIETIVTQKSNPSVHRMAFSSITQKDVDFTVCFKSAALDCEFACLSCSFDLLPMNVKDQFIRGLVNDVLQTDIMTTFHDRILVVNSHDFPHCSAKNEDWD